MSQKLRTTAGTRRIVLAVCIFLTLISGRKEFRFDKRNLGPVYIGARAD